MSHQTRIEDMGSVTELTDAQKTALAARLDKLGAGDVAEYFVGEPYSDSEHTRMLDAQSRARAKAKAAAR